MATITTFSRSLHSGLTASSSTSSPSAAAVAPPADGGSRQAGAASGADAASSVAAAAAASVGRSSAPGDGASDGSDIGADSVGGCDGAPVAASDLRGADGVALSTPVDARDVRRLLRDGDASAAPAPPALDAALRARGGEAVPALEGDKGRCDSGGPLRSSAADSGRRPRAPASAEPLSGSSCASAARRGSGRQKGAAQGQTQGRERACSAAARAGTRLARLRLQPLHQRRVQPLALLNLAIVSGRERQAR